MQIMIILEDYWSPGRVIDTTMMYCLLGMKYIEEMPDLYRSGGFRSMDNIDERYGLLIEYDW